MFGHEGKCRNLHGHNYVLLISARAEQLDSVGRVIDFSVLKQKIGGWIEANWDHGFILWQGDYQGIQAVKLVKDQKLDLMDKNPTAENMAELLLKVVCPMLLRDDGIEVYKVTLWETENCYAEATL